MNQHIGCAIAQRLVTALCLNGIPYEKLVKIVYNELRAINEDLSKGDWLEFPDGSVYTKES